MIYVAEGTQYDKTRGGGFITVKKLVSSVIQGGGVLPGGFLCDNMLLFVSEGELSISCNGTKSVIGKKCCFIAPVFSTLEHSSSYERKTAFIAVYFASTIGFSDIMSNVISLENTRPFTLELIQSMTKMYDPDLKDNSRLEAVFLTILYELESARNATVSGKGVPVEKIAEYVTEGAGLHFSMQDICDRFGYNKDYISRAFKSRYGITVKEYAIRRKIESAKRLLTTTRLSVKQIGEATGFDTVELFYKFFRYHEKISPSEYRRLNK